MAFPAKNSTGEGYCRVKSHDIYNGEVERHVVVGRLIDPVAPAAAKVPVAASRHGDIVGERGYVNGLVPFPDAVFSRSVETDNVYECG